MPRLLVLAVWFAASSIAQQADKVAMAQVIPSLNGAGIPEPFWRKTGAGPTSAPSWYNIQRPVSHEVFYNASLSPDANGDLLEDLLENLSAGDRVVVHAGNYVFQSRLLIEVMGTSQLPVRISAAPGEAVTLSRNDFNQNLIEIDYSQYVILEGFTLIGGDQGIRLYNVAEVMLYDNDLSGTDGAAITANSNNTSGVYIVDNDLHHTGGNGEGVYLGAHDGSIVTHHSYVVGNYVHDLIGPTISQGDGIEVKYGSYAVTVKYNFVESTNYPGIIAYGTGRGLQNRNVIEENVVLFSNDAAMQISAEAIVRNNLVVTNGTAFLSKVDTVQPSSLDVINNTFVTAARGVRVAAWQNAGATNIIFANNAIHSASGQPLPDGTGSATVSNNIIVQNLSTAFVNLTLDGAHLDATPSPSSPLIRAANPRYLPRNDLSGRFRHLLGDAGAMERPW